MNSNVMDAGMQGMCPIFGAAARVIEIINNRKFTEDQSASKVNKSNPTPWNWGRYQEQCQSVMSGVPRPICSGGGGGGGQS
jgi:hypothetical protein